jgi:hypothetical protein
LCRKENPFAAWASTEETSQLESGAPSAKPVRSSGVGAGGFGSPAAGSSNTAGGGLSDPEAIYNFFNPARIPNIFSSSADEGPVGYGLEGRSATENAAVNSGPVYRPASTYSQGSSSYADPRSVAPDYSSSRNGYGSTVSPSDVSGFGEKSASYGRYYGPESYDWAGERSLSLGGGGGEPAGASSRVSTTGSSYLPPC